MHLKISIKLLTLFILIFLLCSCKNTEKIIYKKNITIWLDGNEKEKEFFKKISKTFEENNPDISIKLKFIPFNELKPRFKGQANTTQKPDIIFMVNDWIGELSRADLLASIKMENDHFIPKILDSMKYNNKFYGIPRSFEVVSLIYNKKFVKKAPKTMDELIKLSQKIQKENNIYGLMYDNKNFYYHAPFFLGYSENIFDKNNNLSADLKNSIRSFKFATDLEKKYKIIPERSNYSAMINMFCSEKCAFIITGPWALNKIFKNNIDIGVCVIPILDNNKYPTPFIGVKAFGINKFSKNIASSEKIINFFTSKKIQKKALNELNVLPCIKNIFNNNTNEITKGFYEQSKYGKILPATANMKFIWQEFNWALNNCFIKKDNIDNIVKQAFSKIKMEIKKAKK